MSPLQVDLLLAEDNSSDAELIMESLSALGLGDRMHVVHDGDEALDFLFSRNAYAVEQPGPLPRLVILDVKLPKVSGLDVLRVLKSDPRTRFIPVVMLTSSNVERDVVNGYQYGANSYVQKPVDFEQFRQTVLLLGRYWLQVNEPPPTIEDGPARS